MHPHKHKYKFETKVANRHKHTIMGYTDYMIGVGAFHIHAYYGISSYCGHTHYFSGFTGFPLKTENGHIHKMDNRLESTSNHEHIFRDYTDEDIEYIFPKRLSRAYV